MLDLAGIGHQGEDFSGDAGTGHDHWSVRREKEEEREKLILTVQPPWQHAGWWNGKGEQRHQQSSLEGPRVAVDTEQYQNRLCFA